MDLNYKTNFYNVDVYKPRPVNTNITSPVRTSHLLGPSRDIFVRQLHPVISPNFGSSSTSNGRFLSGLKDITDPYSGAKMLTKEEYGDIKEELATKTESPEKIQYLKKYEKNMLPVERRVFRMFAYEEERHPGMSFSEILKMKYPEANKELIKEQNTIFNSIEDLAQNISPYNKGTVVNEINIARNRVHNSENGNHRFKRKKFIDNLINAQQNSILDDIEYSVQGLSRTGKYAALKDINNVRAQIRKYTPDQNIKGKTTVKMVRNLQRQYLPKSLNKENEFTAIIDEANKLPTSNNRVNAFIIKYHDRDEKEIGERLLEGSVITIEHIHPDSENGADAASNFMGASYTRNQERGNMGFPEFLKRHPNIPKYAQQYTNDIINAAHEGQLPGHEWYPYVFRDTLKKEAGITVSLDNYKIPPQEAFKTIPEELKNRYPKYRNYMPH